VSDGTCDLEFAGFFAVFRWCAARSASGRHAGGRHWSNRPSGGQVGRSGGRHDHTPGTTIRRPRRRSGADMGDTAHLTSERPLRCPCEHRARNGVTPKAPLHRRLIIAPCLEPSSHAQPGTWRRVSTPQRACAKTLANRLTRLGMYESALTNRLAEADGGGGWAVPSGFSTFRRPLPVRRFTRGPRASGGLMRRFVRAGLERVEEGPRRFVKAAHRAGGVVRRFARAWRRLVVTDVVHRR
jgi:hypothetical protein